MGKTNVTLASQDSGSGRLTNWYRSMGFRQVGVNKLGYPQLEAPISRVLSGVAQARMAPLPAAQKQIHDLRSTQKVDGPMYQAANKNVVQGMKPLRFVGAVGKVLRGSQGLERLPRVQGGRLAALDFTRSQAEGTMGRVMASSIEQLASLLPEAGASGIGKHYEKEISGMIKLPVSAKTIAAIAIIETYGFWYQQTGAGRAGAWIPAWQRAKILAETAEVDIAEVGPAFIAIMSDPQTTLEKFWNDVDPKVIAIAIKAIAEEEWEQVMAGERPPGWD